MRLLADEGLVVPQQGKGVFVHSRPRVEPLDIAAEIADLKARVTRLEQKPPRRTT
jgi:DNA-binding GntR family transcriptional regulator